MLSEVETHELITGLGRIAEAIRLRDWEGLAREQLLDRAGVDGCDVEWRAFGSELKTLGHAHLRHLVEEEAARLPLAGGDWQPLWLRMAESPEDRAYDLVAVVDVRRRRSKLEWRLYDLRVA